MEKQINEWRRIAIKPIAGKKLDILTALANVTRAENDKLPMYELAGQMIDVEWDKAKARGLVSDAMLGGAPFGFAAFPQIAEEHGDLGEEEQNGAPVYVKSEEVA